MIKRVGLVIAALILFVLLFIAPKTPPADDQSLAGPALTEANGTENSASVDVYLSTAVKNLGAEERALYDPLIAAGSPDTLARFWDRQKRPDLAAYFAEKKAAGSGFSDDWMRAGNRYFYAVQFISDASEIPVLYQSALRCYGRALEKDPGNTDAQIMIGSCYVESGKDPMKGIAMLREVEKTDSNNVKLQMSLAFFSVKSGQTDKAIERFYKALKADSTQIEAYLHLADLYEQKNDRENTLLMLERYAARTNDLMEKMEVERYIRQLR
jgi:tetratricopeptide (TPR) repeat protein